MFFPRLTVLTTLASAIRATHNIENTNHRLRGGELSGPRHLQSTNPCSLIAIVMDESGSMSGEQAFLRDDAMPDVIAQLKLELEKEVFVCTYGFGASGSFEKAHLHDCSEGFDVSDYAFKTSGGFEDGWEGIHYAHNHSMFQTVIDNATLETTCTSTNKFMILVTDEDRDNGSPFTFNETLDLLKDNDWKLHAILNQGLIPSDAIGAAKNDNGTWTYFLPTIDSNGDPDYNKTLTTTYPIGFGEGTTEIDYVPLAFETQGAVWDLNKLRSGGSFAASFSEAFKDITVELIAKVEASCKDLTLDASCAVEVTPEMVNDGSLGTLSLSPAGPYNDGDVITLTAELNGETATCTSTISLTDPNCECEDESNSCGRIFSNQFSMHRNVLGRCVNACVRPFFISTFEQIGFACGKCP